MKKRVVFGEVGSINVSDIKKTDIVEVVRCGERTGCAVWDNSEGYWRYITVSKINSTTHDSLLGLQNWFPDSEFFVI